MLHAVDCLRRSDPIRIVGVARSQSISADSGKLSAALPRVGVAVVACSVSYRIISYCLAIKARQLVLPVVVAAEIGVGVRSRKSVERAAGQRVLFNELIAPSPFFDVIIAS
jgi:hypothetical protein